MAGLFWHESGTDATDRTGKAAPAAQASVNPCLQSTPRLSETVAHLVLRHEHIRCDRLASGPVVVSFGGQLVVAGSGKLAIRSVDCAVRTGDLGTWWLTCQNGSH